MEFVTFEHNGLHYAYDDSNSLKIYLLGRFLISDARYGVSNFRKWALDDKDDYTSSNITELDKEDGYIYLSDIYSGEKVPTVCKISIQQFVGLLDGWGIILASKPRPHKIRIIHKDNQFTIEIVHENGFIVAQWYRKIKKHILGRLCFIRFLLRLRLLALKRYCRRITATRRYARFERGCRKYNYDGGSDNEMDILGEFLEDDVRLSTAPYMAWVLDDSCINMSIILHRKDEYIVLRNTFSQETFPAELTMSIQQFAQLLDDWNTKVCIPRPKIVTVWCDNDQFMIETSE